MRTYSSKQWQPTDGIEGLLVPKRIIKPSYYSVIGRAPSPKNRSSQQSESQLEQDFLVLLEFDRQVARYGVQPITIRWSPASGRTEQYTPDVVVVYHTQINSGPILPPTLFEVKPRQILQRDWGLLRPKYSAATAWSREHGFRFKLITDVQIRTPYLNNVRFLSRYRERAIIRNEELDTQRHIFLREALRKLNQSTPNALLRFVTDKQNLQLELIPILWQMMYIGTICADLSKPLSMSTPIWLRKGAE